MHRIVVILPLTLSGKGGRAGFRRAIESTITNVDLIEVLPPVFAILKVQRTVLNSARNVALLPTLRIGHASG